MVEMCVGRVGKKIKISKRDFTFIREMRVPDYQNSRKCLSYLFIRYISTLPTYLIFKNTLILFYKQHIL